MTQQEQERQAIEEAAESFCKKRRLDSTGYPPKAWFKAGVDFALSELRKPREENKTRIKELKPDRQQLVDALNTFKVSGEDAGCWADAIIDSFEQSEPCDPSDPIGRTDEELVKIMDDVEAMNPYKMVGKRETYSRYNEGWCDAVDVIRSKTAAIIPSSRCQENDVKLLEAAKDALRTFYGVGCTDEAEIVQELKEAITNA